MALFLAFKMNVARHLLLVLLIPDKRGLRNIAVAVPLALHAAFPSTITRCPTCFDRSVSSDTRK